MPASMDSIGKPGINPGLMLRLMVNACPLLLLTVID
jgi:hypothetical protein